MWIYKITNTTNGKLYIGQTIRPIKDRFRRHINDALNNSLDTHFARAIRKYGEKCFTIEVIDTAENQEELTKKESYWIEKLNSISIGYNETSASFKCGGNTYLSKTEDEIKLISEKIRLSKLGGKNPNASSIKLINIITHEEVVYKSMSECIIDLGLKNHTCLSKRARGIIKKPLLNKYLVCYC